MSYHSKCFRCGEWFNSPNFDDQFGDGECATCALKSRDIAKRVDEQIAMQNAGQVKAPKIVDPRFFFRDSRIG